jgi:tetratricopeptide (TPR) repeat protein
MRGWIHLLLASGLCLGTATWGWAAEAPQAGDLLKQASLAWDKRTDPAETRRALELYEQAAAADPALYDAYWGIARGCVWAGNHVPPKERLAVFEKGKVAGEKAVQLKPDGIEGHYWLGVCLGRYGEERGVLKSLFLVDPIAKEMEAVLALDPKYGDAQHVLGVLYRKAPGWPLSRGDMKKSLDFAQQAVANCPNVVLPRLGLAYTLLALNRPEAAKQELQTALTLPGPADRQPETVEDKQEAQTLLKTIK